MRDILLAIDPGPHTGVALFFDNLLARTLLVHEPTRTAQYRALADLLHEAKSIDPDAHIHVVIEDYRSQTTMTLPGYITVHLIGFLEGVAYLHGYTVTLQLPARRKAFLGRAAALARRTSPHERDAVAQGLAYIARSITELIPAIPLQPTVPFEAQED